MKNKIVISLVTGLAMLAAGSAGASDSRMLAQAPGVDATTGVAEPTTQEYELPFGLPMAPDTRIVNGHAYEGPVGMESYAALATTGSVRDAITFFEQAAVDAGFQVYSRNDEPDNLVVAAKRDDDRVMISNASGYVDVEEGETELRISGKWPK